MRGMPHEHTELVDIARVPHSAVHIRDAETMVVTVRADGGPVDDARVGIDTDGRVTPSNTEWGSSHVIPPGQPCRGIDADTIGCGPLAAGETKTLTFLTVVTGFPKPHLFWKAFGATTEIGFNEDLAG